MARPQRGGLKTALAPVEYDPDPRSMRRLCPNVVDEVTMGISGTRSMNASLGMSEFHSFCATSDA